MARLAHIQSLANAIVSFSTHERTTTVFSSEQRQQLQQPCRWNAYPVVASANREAAPRKRGKCQGLSKSCPSALKGTGTRNHDLHACEFVSRKSHASSNGNVNRGGGRSSWSLKVDESDNSAPADANSESNALADDTDWNVEASRSSSEGLATDCSGNSFHKVDFEQDRDNSLDSSEGLITDARDKARASRSFGIHLERERENSRNSIEGLANEENNLQWRNVFPSYMQSRESDSSQDPDDSLNEAVGHSPDSEPRNPRAKEAAAAAVAFAKECDPQVGSHLISSASSPEPSTRPATDVKRRHLNNFIVHDPIWAAIRAEAKLGAEREPLLSSFLYASILAHPCFERSLGFVLANRLKNATLLATQLLDVFDDVLMHDPYIRHAIRLDVQAVKDRDPSCGSYSLALLYLKGYHSLQAYRVAHALWNRGQKVLAFALQSRISEVLAVDIHPAARLGKAILLDHGTGVVIGETAVVGDRVSMLQGVTLGGTGKAAGDRHPKIKEGVLVGAGATILGNIVVGKGAMVAAGSLVLKNVPPHSMVAGTPARVIGYLDESIPSLTMEQDAAKNFCEEVQRHVLQEGAGI